MFIKKLIDSEEVSEVGGKGANLGKLVRAGFAVPDGFVITTAAFREAPMSAQQSGIAAIENEILAAYHALGSPPVAVRSSATAEDMAAASMAGQYETFLDVRGDDELLAKVRECWASLDSPRIHAYLAEHGIERSAVAMGVVVQKLVPADVAGVLFTINPHAHDPQKPEMLIEASWGLGESVVGGRVQPDVIHLSAASGDVTHAVIADKRTMIAAGAHGEIPVDEARRKAACLSEGDIHKLWELGKKAAAHFGGPQDIEWAISKGEVFLLQSRPITTHQDAEFRRERLDAARTQVAEGLAAKRGPWALHNLAETLPHPTPLTWSVIRHFMSGAGGFGNMYRMAGFEPSPEVCREGFLDLIGGRIYMDASRAPEMFFENFPFAYDVDELKRSPDASQLPPTLARGPLAVRLKAGKRLAAVNTKLRAISENLDRDLREQHLAALKEYVGAARTISLKAVSDAELRELWQQHEKRVMDDFAPRSLLPSLVCGMALADLKSFLEEHLWQEDPDALAQSLSAGGLANRTLMADADLYELAHGERGVQSWLDEHGHRGAGEFDLAAPRWREKPAALIDMAARLAKGEKPLERHRKSAEETNRRIAAIHARLMKVEGDAAVTEFDRRLDLVRRYMPFREDGKDFLMMGYELLREVACEFGRRLGIGDGVFFLTKEEMLDAPRQGIPAGLIDSRRKAHKIEEKISLPRVIDSPDSLAAAGAPRPTAALANGGHKGFAISAGFAKGKARILRSPTDAGELERGYILVCPSTDPSWTPLFVNAAGLILEVGGTLSHGAVVAREMGLPAVVVPNATEIFADGEEIIVDGNAGWVGTSAAEGSNFKYQISNSGAGISHADPADTAIPRDLIPPVAGPKDRRAAKVRNIAAAVWAVFVIAFFLLPPAWVYGPTLAFMDRLLWPLVRAVGRPWTVAIAAGFIAVITLLLQKLMTDNQRLLEAKRRAAELLRQAGQLPAESPRRRALERFAAPVQARVLAAALVPVGMLLGPMVIPFSWFKERMETDKWNAAAGTPVEVVAYVDPAWQHPITLTIPPPLELDRSTPSAQAVPPLRPTLEQLLALYQAPPLPTSPDAWRLQAGPGLTPADAAADLRSYLAAGVPPQPLRWQILPPEHTTGAFPLMATTDSTTARLTAVLGDDNPPEPSHLTATGPIRELRLTYAKDPQQRIFWRPFAFLGNASGSLAKIGNWDAGWVWLYVIAYLPVLFGTRAVLKVA
ncbi:MAG TPA: PEP/pyruvate-binding domain-containing protein [Phycisphaerae bacterium]|nr:PEP/pyruvate-binding domain-containing protein [Phycisphaerae bacterium]